MLACSRFYKLSKAFIPKLFGVIGLYFRNDCCQSPLVSLSSALCNMFEHLQNTQHSIPGIMSFLDRGTITHMHTLPHNHDIHIDTDEIRTDKGVNE